MFFSFKETLWFLVPLALIAIGTIGLYFQHRVSKQPSEYATGQSPEEILSSKDDVETRPSVTENNAGAQAEIPRTNTKPTAAATGTSKTDIHLSEGTPMHSRTQAQDVVRLSLLRELAVRLDLYHFDHIMFPEKLEAVLTDEYDGAGLFNKEGYPSRQYFYYFAYARLENGVPTGACGSDSEGRQCQSYHLGVNLENIENFSMYTSDKDIVSEKMNGLDVNGCFGEREKLCYDIVGE